MARRLFHLGLVGLVLVAGVASYAVRRNLCPPEAGPMDCARRWLDLSSTQCRNIRRRDPDFRLEAQTLAEALEGARQALSTLVADRQTSDEALAAQAQAVLDAHHALMRRTVRHLLAIREFADISQCVRLKSLCSNAMRCGQGRGMGMGLGMGMGRRHMHGKGLGPALTLTPAQQEAADEIAPDFEAECLDLMQQVREAHLALFETLQDTASSDQSVLQALETFIAARTAFEQHTMDYVISIRSLLTEDQQHRLIGLCRGDGHLSG